MPSEPTPGLAVGADGRLRCSWSTGTPDYVAYHDDEWGRPVSDDVRILEKLCLEGFQSGLSWLTILRKREGFRRAFAGFEPATVAAFGEGDITRLLADAGIVRHRGKIEATIANARATVTLHEAGLSLAGVVWAHEPARRGRPVPTGLSQLPSTNPQSVALAKELRRRGFRFIGPTTAYAAMQSLGLVNDHLAGCHARDACERDRRAMGAVSTVFV
ncbi:MAG TPA: DNA-3-methyladenine glycosylase I [Acidimicrobiales bacterium]